MEKQKKNTRDVLQYLALFIVLGTQIVRLILYMTEVAYTFPEKTLNLWMYIGFGVAIAILLVSYLFPKKKQSA
ncbi:MULTISPECIES: hypothetical protein [unclassified Sporosarcina]|uniref:hypothetical protein n=1 Tax=unclassified Sporosarcina TaxID=2647733 RepID=UPI000C16DE58|nr:MULTISPECIES: hypothetical protein [unclassified Sporosarcina]PIC97877.1 hypothetical protein CSV68_16110 [Sporosarcina sp. P29]PID05484.1 hypothetical protein CSV66_09700 [Sporosarcina sp. P30]PID08675.1 hypothetical protein CSV65_09665 [Sporosarcina sp. P31]PID11677.1 hypothetical protein CSV64_10630 [Sporosarcina sp. P32b]